MIKSSVTLLCLIIAARLGDGEVLFFLFGFFSKYFQKGEKGTFKKYSATIIGRCIVPLIK